MSTLRILARSRNPLNLAIHRGLQRIKVKSRNNPRHFGWRLLLSILGHAGYVAKAVCKTDIRHITEFGEGVFLSERGLIVIGAKSIGPGSVIHHRVTIGVDVVTKQTPEIAENVWIGPDCVIHGGITVGAGATILPGTVVSKSIPQRSVVVGIPCRIIGQDFDNQELRSSVNFNVCEKDFVCAPAS